MWGTAFLIEWLSPGLLTLARKLWWGTFAFRLVVVRISLWNSGTTIVYSGIINRPFTGFKPGSFGGILLEFGCRLRPLGYHGRFRSSVALYLIILISAGKCDIFPKSKQHCKRCRYDKCVRIGMDPKWVLTNDEKRIRFKNFFKKKDEMAPTDCQVLETPSSGTPKRKRFKADPLARTKDECYTTPLHRYVTHFYKCSHIQIFMT